MPLGKPRTAWVSEHSYVYQLWSCLPDSFHTPRADMMDAMGPQTPPELQTLVTVTPSTGIVPSSGQGCSHSLSLPAASLPPGSHSHPVSRCLIGNATAAR